MTHLTVALAALVLGACEAEDPEHATAPLAVEAAAPPGVNPLTFEIEGTLEPGSPITFRVSGAAANASVHLVRGVNWRFNALCPPALGGLCLDVVQPQIFNTVQADAQGVATLTTVVPNLPDLTKVFFQAVTGGAHAATSAVIPKWNPMPDQAGQAHLTLSSVVTVSPGSYVGVRLERYYADAAPAMDVCSIRYDVSGTGVAPLPPCPSCDFAFNVTHANPTETTTSGDCLGLMDLDVPTIAPFHQGWGFDHDYVYGANPPSPVAVYFDTSTGAWVAAANATFTNPNLYWSVEWPQAGYTYIY